MSIPPSTATPAGSIELMVLTLPMEQVDGSVIEALREVVESGDTRLLDLAVLVRAGDGSVAIFDEVDELAQIGLGDISPPDSQVLLSEDDLAMVADELDPGQCALVTVAEQTWVSRVSAAAEQAGGQLGMHAQVSRDAYEAAARATV